MTKLNHIDTDGNAVMVDIVKKNETERIAVATGSIFMKSTTLELINKRAVKKGDVLSVAQIAGIMGSKRTPDLIPLCHPINLTSVNLILTPNMNESSINIEATCKVFGRTGVEMEALTAVTVTALTIYDMCKAADREMRISDVRLIYKTGGKSGEYRAIE
ncbi:MAG: cyclic pyranopterin monophosphate synthase MoaC [Rhodospirillaceae bacterium]|nr:cyclic pyranopterin monophosphate synthase MoaC [Rhodospirillaceae bacterium]OUT79841.1 MAG: cyclic pyranopterin monophosphate synthase MoaC [Rhodospirillaceae bacterium TMED23]|tara:strand:+ start:16088 stop:16567 length:480 start_codon:yes stop_codon:yes gene_type:complete